MLIQRIDHWPIGGTPTLTGRAHSLTGSGSSTGFDGEGKYLTSADVSTIVAAAYRLDSSTPDTSLGSITITSAAIITAVTSGFGGLGRSNNAGQGPYNFKWTPSMSLITTRGGMYRVTVDITQTDGTKLSGAWEAIAQDVSP